MNTAASRSRHAFTLIEVLSVVVILGIVGAVVIPQMSDRSDLVVSAASRQLLSDLMYAQNRAITNQTPMYVVFTPASGTGPGGSYTLMTALPSTPLTHPISRKDWVITFGTANSGTPGGSAGALRNVRLDSADFDTQTALMFDESGAPQSIPAAGGSPAPLTSGTIKLLCNGSALTIKVEPLTGTLSLQ